MHVKDGGTENSNDNTDIKYGHYKLDLVSQKALLGLQKPPETLSFRQLQATEACWGGTPWMLALLLPHLDCTALPHY